MSSKRPSRDIAQTSDERIAELERALHEALNFWAADVPGDDDNRDRLRSIADNGAVTP